MMRNFITTAWMFCLLVPAGLQAQSHHGPILTLTASSHAAQNRDGVWLGVQLSPVPDALASHLGLGDQGVMIDNVFINSPADGQLERYDVVIEAKGKTIDSIGRLADIVGQSDPGETVKLQVIRGGQDMTLELTLDPIPASDQQIRLRYDPLTDFGRRHRMGLRGKVLRPSPYGWVYDDIDQFMDQLPAVPLPSEKDMREYHKQLDRFSKWLGTTREEIEKRAEALTRPAKPHPEIRHASRKLEDGTVLEVERNDDGTITVTRRPAEGDEAEAKVKRYDDPKALQESDPQAYELLYPYGTYIDWKKWNKAYEEYQNSLNDYIDKLEEYDPTPEIKRQWRSWNDYLQDEYGVELEELTSPSESEASETSARESDPSPIQFDVGADGSITMKSTRGSAQLQMTFESEADLKQREPRLHELYLDLRAGLE